MGAEVTNPGYGIVPSTEASATFGMDDRMCEVTEQGQLASDPFIVGDIAHGYVVHDGGLVFGEHPMDGEVMAGRMTENGLFVIESSAAGCFAVWIHPDGTQEQTALESGACTPDIDVEAAPNDRVLVGGPHIVQIDPKGFRCPVGSRTSLPVQVASS